MSITHSHVKKILKKKNITPVEYFCLEKECALIKCFLNNLGEMLLIYVSSKHRFALENDKGYELEDIEDNEPSESDDYTDATAGNIENIINSDKDTIFNELTKNYKKSISVDVNDEPVTRKLKRQLARLKIPLAKLQYNIAIQMGKTMGLLFDDEVTFFNVRSYHDLKTKEFFYLVNLDQFISKIDEIPQEIAIIKDQFQTIVFNASVANLSKISHQISNFNTDIKNIKQKIDEYYDAIKKYVDMYKRHEDDFSSAISQLRSSDKDSQLKRAMTDTEIQKKTESHIKSSNDIIQDGIQLIKRFYYNILTLESISFDNCVMVLRVENNFQLLATTFNL